MRYLTWYKNLGPPFTGMPDFLRLIIGERPRGHSMPPNCLSKLCIHAAPVLGEQCDVMSAAWTDALTRDLCFSSRPRSLPGRTWVTTDDRSAALPWSTRLATPCTR